MRKRQEAKAWGCDCTGSKLGGLGGAGGCSRERHSPWVELAGVWGCIFVTRVTLAAFPTGPRPAESRFNGLLFLWLFTSKKGRKIGRAVPKIPHTSGRSRRMLGALGMGAKSPSEPPQGPRSEGMVPLRGSHRERSEPWAFPARLERGASWKRAAFPNKELSPPPAPSIPAAPAARRAPGAEGQRDLIRKQLIKDISNPPRPSPCRAGLRAAADACWALSLAHTFTKLMYVRTYARSQRRCSEINCGSRAA